MKCYPSIDTQVVNIDIYAFDKIDGSSIRAEWSKKRGFYKFGTRHRMLGSDDPMLGSAIELVINKYDNDISNIMKVERIESAVCFFEFSGEHSAFGLHDNNELHDVVLFDVDVFKKGLLPPKEFLNLFGKLDIAKLLYLGKPNTDFLNQVNEGSLPGMTFEGVVCKAKHPKKPGVLMFKVKSQAWRQALRKKCGTDDKLYEALS